MPALSLSPSPALNTPKPPLNPAASLLLSSRLCHTLPCSTHSLNITELFWLGKTLRRLDIRGDQRNPHRAQQDRQKALEWGSCITAALATPAPGERKTPQGAGGGWRGCTARPGRCSRGQEPQEVSCSPVPEGTARSLLSVTLLWISPALCPHTLCTHFFFPILIFGAFLQTL